MIIHSFNEDTGKLITAFDSNFIMTRMVKTLSTTHIGMVFIKPGETIGFHKAVCIQLLLIIEGEGWVRGDNSERKKIRKGEAVLWEKGEWHETMSETGLTALVIESENLLPWNYIGMNQ